MKKGAIWLWVGLAVFFVVVWVILCDFKAMGMNPIAQLTGLVAYSAIFTIFPASILVFRLVFQRDRHRIGEKPVFALISFGIPYGLFLITVFCKAVGWNKDMLIGMFLPLGVVFAMTFGIVAGFIAWDRGEHPLWLAICGILLNVFLLVLFFRS